jgi:hypothetical protein
MMVITIISTACPTLGAKWTARAFAKQSVTLAARGVVDATKKNTGDTAY